MEYTYEQALEKVMKCKTPSERLLNKLFLDFGFSLIDCDSKFKRGEEEVGEIDGIFIIKDKYLFLIEISDEKNLSPKKIGEFYSKWSDKDNLALIFNKYGTSFDIPREIKIVRILLDFNEEHQPITETKESLKHHFKDGTNNKILSKEELDDLIEGYEKIGKWAKNDLLFLLGIEFDGDTNSRPAIRINMNGQKAYLFTATAYELLNSCCTHRRNERFSEGYQRILSKKRVDTIKKEIEGGKIIAFPNSIILNSLDELDSTKEESSEVCKIDFPRKNCSMLVIDGQHRLMGFAKLTEKMQKDHFLPVVAFEKLDPKKELGTFIKINSEQKTIDKNLLLVLISDFDWSPSEEKYFKQKVAVEIIKKLNEQKESPLHDKIFLGYNEKRKITLTTLVGAILRNNLIGGKYNLLRKNLDDLDGIYSSTKFIFDSMQEKLTNYSDIGDTNSPRGFFYSNQGLRILFRLVQTLYRNNFYKLTNKIALKEFFEDINSIIDDEFIKELKEGYGEGGANNKTTMLLEKLKKEQNEKYKDFEVDLRKV